MREHLSIFVEIVLIIKALHFLDFLEGVHFLEVVYTEDGSRRDQPPQPVVAQGRNQIVAEGKRPSEKLLHIVHVGLVHFYCLELLMQELETEKCEEHTLDKGDYTKNEGNHVTLEGIREFWLTSFWVCCLDLVVIML